MVENKEIPAQILSDYRDLFQVIKNFYISMGVGPKRVQVQLVFSLTQHIRDQALMNSLISYLGCGNIKHNEKNS